MFTTVRAIAFAASLLVVPRSVEPQPFPDASSVLGLINRLVFVVPLADFIREADTPTHDTRVDWTSDGCSAPLIHSTGRSFNFVDSCRRHDFAYRNFSRIDRGILWTPPLRHRVDRMFLRDMRCQCSTRRPYDRPTCNAWAFVFYHSVRIYAGP